MKFQGTEKIYDAYREQFGSTPGLMVSAPGRVNLIGEHTDYNDGFVLPMAIDRKIGIGGALRDDDQVRLYSLNFQEMAAFALTSLKKEGTWADYVKGVIAELLQAGHQLKGFQAAIYGNVPLGGGLSSSAAMEVAAAFFLAQLHQLRIAPEEMAKLCQRAENRFVGMNCGIMDQFISRLGRQGSALYLDCRDLSYQQIPFEIEGYVVVICNSHVKRQLVNSAYNERRAQCEAGVRLLRSELGNITALRDVSSAQLAAYQTLLPPVVYQRCKHVITENERVAEAVAVLREGDIGRFGLLLNQSHESLRQDYEVSCAEVDTLAAIARQVPGTAGSRMTGAGFGGCTVSLVRETALAAFERTVLAEYARQTGLTAEIYVSKAEEGARVEVL